MLLIVLHSYSTFDRRNRRTKKRDAPCLGGYMILTVLFHGLIS